MPHRWQKTPIGLLTCSHSCRGLVAPEWGDSAGSKHTGQAWHQQEFRCWKQLDVAQAVSVSPALLEQEPRCPSPLIIYLLFI